MRNYAFLLLRRLPSLLVLLVLFPWATSPLRAQSSCSCTDYIYLNDEEGDLVHKFAVDPTTGALTEIGNPWLPPGTVQNPHGIVSDINGDIFVGQLNGFDNQALMGPIFRVDCSGQAEETDVLPGENFGYNFGTVGSTLYFADGNRAEIEAYSTCDGSFLGSIDLESALNAGVFDPFDSDPWGFTVPGDGSAWYATERFTGGVFTGTTDTSQYTFPPTASGSVLFQVPEAGAGAAAQGLMGITLDGDGDIFVVLNNLAGSFDSTVIRKYSPDGTLLAEVVDTDQNPGGNQNDGEQGFWGARGITYSAMSDLIYVGNRDNCVTVFSTDLVEQVALNVNNATDSRPKGIALLAECCPLDDELTIDAERCLVQVGGEVFLQDLIRCEGGPICEGEWTVVEQDTGLSFDECENTVSAGVAGCGTYTLSADGTAPNAQCGEFLITLNLCLTGSDCGNFPWPGE